jgi:hypothetical protein
MNEHASAENGEFTGSSSPTAASVYNFLVYGLSLPERTLRGTSAIVGGAIKQSADLLLPGAFRDSRSYQTLVGQMLDFMIKDVAGLPAANPDVTKSPEIRNYVARKTAGSFVDLAGMATLHLSPLTVLAIISDIAYGSKTYLTELSHELKREGIIAPESTIDSTAALLDAIGNSAGTTASALDVPPLSVDGLRETIAQSRQAVAAIDPSCLIPLSEIERTWTELRRVATQQNVSLFSVSSAVTMFALNRVNSVSKGALSTVRVTGNMFERHIIQHYREGIGAIGERGMWEFLSDNSKPYVDAVWENFSPGRETVTGQLVSGRLIARAWKGVTGWLGSGNPSPPSTPPDGGG